MPDNLLTSEGNQGYQGDLTDKQVIRGNLHQFAREYHRSFSDEGSLFEIAITKKTENLLLMLEKNKLSKLTPDKLREEIVKVVAIACYPEWDDNGQLVPYESLSDYSLSPTKDVAEDILSLLTPQIEKAKLEIYGERDEYINSLRVQLEKADRPGCKECVIDENGHNTRELCVKCEATIRQQERIKVAGEIFKEIGKGKSARDYLLIKAKYLGETK